MTRATILQLRDEYAAILDHAGAVAEHIYDTRHVVRALEDQQMMLNHARWACDEILRQIDNLGGQQLCVRYLGILQAILVVYGLVNRHASAWTSSAGSAGLAQVWRANRAATLRLAPAAR